MLRGHRRNWRRSRKATTGRLAKSDNGNGRIKLPKIGWLRYRKSQEVLGATKNVTISESCGKWFVAVQTEREVETPLHRSTSVVGLDWGVVRLYTLSK